MDNKTIVAPRRTRPKLTIRQRRFTREYIKSGVASTAVIKAGYNAKNVNVATSMGSELLTNPKVIAELDYSGFTEENAKGVVQEIMLDGNNDPSARLKATDQVFKVKGSYAPDKQINIKAEISQEDFTTLLEMYSNKRLDMSSDSVA